MQIVDKKKLQQYIYTKIDNINNPQSFKHQLETQISNHMKRREHQLKMNHIKMKNEKKYEEEVRRRGELEGKVSAKLEKGVNNRHVKLNERVQSMMNLRQRKQQYVFERQKMSRKEQLQKSLQKIKQFEEDRRIRSQIKLQNSQQQISKSSTFDNLNKRNLANQQEYDYLVQKLQKKGIFKSPSTSIPKSIDQIYHRKIKQSRYNQSQKQEETIHRFGQKLSKIEEARKKKQSLMLEKTQKLKDIQRFQNQLKHNNLSQLQKARYKKLKQLQMKNALYSSSIHQPQSQSQAHIDRSTLIKIDENPKLQQRYTTDDKRNNQRQEYTMKLKNVNYKNEIRKHIDSFMKKNGTLIY